MRRIRASLVAIAVTAAGMVPAVAVAAARRTPLVPTFVGTMFRHDLQRRPFRIFYSGDGAAFLAGRSARGVRHAGHLRWTTWNASQGRAWGADWHDNCRPNCANGHYTGSAANVRLYRPRTLGGHWVFTRLTVSYPGRRPSARSPRSWTMRLTYSARFGRSFVWRS